MKHFDDWIVLFALLVIFCAAAAIMYDGEQIHGAQAIRTGTYYYQCVPTVDAVAKQKSEAL